MIKEAKSIWFEIESLSIPGKLTAADRIALEMLSNLLAESRSNHDRIMVDKYGPLIGLRTRLA